MAGGFVWNLMLEIWDFKKIRECLGIFIELLPELIFI